MRMFDDAFTDFKGEVEPAESRVAHFEVFHDAQRVQVVIEKVTVRPHGCVQRFFSSVPEGRMAYIMHQGERFHQVDVQPELSSNGAGNLRYLNSVSKAIAEMVGVTTGENLRLSLQPAKRARMDDAITIALKIVAVGMLRLGITASAGLFHPHGVFGEHEQSLTAIVRWISFSETRTPKTNRPGVGSPTCSPALPWPASLWRTPASE